MALCYKNGPSLRNAPSSAKNPNRHLASNSNFLNSNFSLYTGHLPCENLPLVRNRSQARAPFLEDLHLSPSRARTLGHPLSNLSESTMAKTRWAKTLFPSGRHKALIVAHMQGSMTEPSQPLAVPPSVEGAPLSSPSKWYETRRPPTTRGARSSRAKKSTSHPPKKKARISAPVEPSEPSSEPQPPQSPAIESQIPSRMTPEVVIRRPMVNQPPIEGNLDCQARSFHSELCFDRATFRLQPKLRDSFHLLQRYHMEHLMTPRDFFYPRVALDFYQSMTTHHVWDPTVIHFTIDGCHGILGARHSRGPVHSLWASTSRGLSSVGSSFSEWYGSYTIQRDIHTPISIEEWAPSQHSYSHTVHTRFRL